MHKGRYGRLCHCHLLGLGSGDYQMKTLDRFHHRVGALGTIILMFAHSHFCLGSSKRAIFFCVLRLRTS